MNGVITSYSIHYTKLYEYNGKIPENFDELIKLPGVGRKTANVIMDCAFNKSVGVVVDTHVKRLRNNFV